MSDLVRGARVWVWEGSPHRAPEPAEFLRHVRNATGRPMCRVGLFGPDGPIVVVVPYRHVHRTMPRLWDLKAHGPRRAPAPVPDRGSAPFLGRTIHQRGWETPGQGAPAMPDPIERR